MSRWIIALYVLALLPLNWLGMMLVHETGHMLGALVSGGQVTRVIWPLVGFSRTDIEPNPHPAFVVWCGPLWGALLPLAALMIVRLARLRPPHPLRVFAGFCLIANGVYLSLGTLDRAGDAFDLVRLGTPPWTLWLLGAALAAAGLALWHCMGPRFGLAPDHRPTPLMIIITCGLGLALMIASALTPR